MFGLYCEWSNERHKKGQTESLLMELFAMSDLDGLFRPYRRATQLAPEGVEYTFDNSELNQAHCTMDSLVLFVEHCSGSAVEFDGMIKGLQHRM